MLSGADAARFDISSTGAVTFRAAPDFEIPADAGANNVYNIAVTASDGTLSSAARGVIITVTNAVEATSLTALGAGIAFAENAVNAAPQLLDADVAFASEASLSGGRVVVMGLLAEDRVSVLTEGNGAGQIGVSGSTISYGGVAFGTASNGGNASLTPTSTFTVTFNSNVTTAAVDALIQRLAYANTSDAPTATRDLTINVIEGTGAGLGGSGTLTALTGTANPFNGIDVGYSPAPAFVDLNGDGLLDFVSGNGDGTLLAWRNRSTSAAPVFTALTGTANPFNGFDVGYRSKPVFVNLDGDGLLDLVSGEEGGTLKAWRNTGTVTAPTFTGLTGTANPFNGIDVGQFSAPAFVDLNGDGLLDLVSGESNGTLLAWRNTGTHAAPVFAALTGTANPFNGIDPGNGSTPAFQDLNGDGLADLVLGESDGRILTWRNTGTSAAPVFTALTGTANPYNGIDVGIASAPAFVHLNDDGLLDLVSGEFYGTLFAWSKGGSLPKTTVTVTAQNDAPSVTSGAIASLAENATGTVYQATGTDPEGTALSYTLGGSDAALFNISSTGAVSFKVSPNFEAPADADGNNVYDITVIASDGALSSTARAVAITVTNVNEAPGLTSGTTASFAENGADAAYQVTGADPEGATLGYTLGGTDAALFNISSSGAVSFKVAPNFEAPADAGADNVYDITVTASDGTLNSAAMVVALTVANVMEAATLSGFAAGITFAENTVNAAPQLLDADVVFTGEVSLAGGRLVVSGLLAEDRLSVLTQGNGAGQIGLSGGSISYGGIAFGIASGGSGSDFTVSFNSSVTAAAVDALIQRLAYADPSDAPTTTRDLAINVIDSTGLGFGGIGPLAAMSSTLNPFNGIDAGTLSGPAFVDLNGDGLLDLVSGNNFGTLLAWRNTGISAAPAFTGLTGTANPFNSFVVGYNSAPAFVDLNGDGLLDLVSGSNNGTLLAWRNTGTSAAPVFTRLTGTANPFNGIDVGSTSTPAFVDLNGDGVLDLVSGESYGTLLAWINTGTTAQPVFTSLTGTANPFSGIDVGNRSAPAFVELNGDGLLDLVSGELSGTLLAWRNTGTSAAPVFTALTGTANPFSGIQVGPPLNYGYSKPTFVDLNRDGLRDLVAGESSGTLLAWSNGTPPPPKISVTVTAQNDAPSLTSGATASFAENGTGVAYLAMATDPEGAVLSYALGGADAALFNISSAGAVSFKLAPNFEAAADAGHNNVYDITVAASDGEISTAARAVAVTVTNVNEAPSVTSVATASFAENATGTVYRVTATDPVTAALSYALGGTDAALFNISTAGLVTFKVAPNFEAPADSGGDNVYDITVTASDGTLSSAARAVAIAVTNVVEATAMTGLAAGVTFAENIVNAAPQLLDAEVAFTTKTSLSGGRMVVSGLLAEDQVSALSQGDGAGQIGVSGSTIRYGGTAFGTASGGSGGDFIVAFNSSATVAAVDALIQRLAYGDTSDTPTASRDLTINVWDGAGAVLGGGIGALTYLRGTASPFYGVGSAGKPVFVDLDGDGRLDLVSGEHYGALHAWRNTGTSAAPVFTALTGSADPFSGIDVGYYSAPAVVDLDGDGKLDLVSGQHYGTLLAWRNTGTSAAPIFTALTGSANPFDGIDVGYSSAPAFVDLDGDGRLDLVSGEYGGKLLAWHNTGTNAAPVFTALAGSANPFDGIDAGYNSTPAFVDLDGDGDLDLVMGSYTGTLQAWRNTGTGAAPVFTALSGSANPFFGKYMGQFSAPAFTDVNADGLLDLVSGGYSSLTSLRNGASAVPRITVTVTAQDDAPSIASGATARVAENSTGTVYQATATDPEGTTSFTWTLAGADAALFDISSTGAVSFRSAPNFEAPSDAGGDNVYDITVTASDGVLGSAGRAVAITTTNVNEAPSFTSGATARFAENGSGTVYQAIATDPEGAALTYALSGADAGLFNISSIGAVTFKVVPNFEAPADAGANNGYSITVLANDGARTGQARVAIIVTDVVEAVHVEGGTGNDKLPGTAGEDTLSGNAGNDTLLGGVGSDSLDGGVGADSIVGDAGNDTLLGGDGNDRLNGGLGADSMAGGTGNDTYTVDDSGDVVVEAPSEGTDTVQTTLGTYTLGANVENLAFTGAGSLVGMGNALANSLTGGAGSDTLLGGDGNDVVDGGLGADSLAGGLGADRFLFKTAGEANRDVIADFSAAQGDRIDLRPLDADALLVGDQAFTWIGGVGFAGVAGQVRFAGGMLEGDVDGDGLADFQIALTGMASLTAASIWL